MKNKSVAHANTTLADSTPCGLMNTNKLSLPISSIKTREIPRLIKANSPTISESKAKEIPSIIQKNASTIPRFMLLPSFEFTLRLISAKFHNKCKKIKT